MKWQEEIIIQAKVAVETGRELRFTPIKRDTQGIIKWRIYLTDLVAHGEEKTENKII